MHCLRWTWLQRRNLKCGRERGGGRQRGKTCLRELSCCNAGVWKADEASKWDAGSASGIAGSASEIDGKSHRSRNPLERWQTRDKTEVTTAPMRECNATSVIIGVTKHVVFRVAVAANVGFGRRSSAL